MHLNTVEKCNGAILTACPGNLGHVRNNQTWKSKLVWVVLFR